MDISKMIGLPQPTLSFTIPSLHDAKVLNCRIYHPKQSCAHASSKRGAIVAHPYAPFGGCYDDPIVGIVGNEILKHGWVVMTFNFRGAGESQGKTSWTSKAECVDYASVASLFIHYLALMEPRCHNPASSGGKQAGSIDLIVGGYSYGSMIANHLPPIPSLLARFRTPSQSNAAREIVLRAEHLAAQTNQEIRLPEESPRKSYDHTLSIGGDEPTSGIISEVTEHGNKRQSFDHVSKKLHLRKTRERGPEIEDLKVDSKSPGPPNFDFQIRTHYLLVSPLLPPVATLTALPFASPSNSEEHIQKLATNATLVIYGEEDGFTSSKRLNVWCRDIAKANPRFQGVEVDCAGHFWRELGVAQELVQTVGTWVSKLAEQDHKL